MKKCAECGHGETEPTPNYCPDCGTEWEVADEEYPIEICFQFHHDSVDNKTWIDDNFPQYDPYNNPTEVPENIWKMFKGTFYMDVELYEDGYYTIKSINDHEVEDNRSLA